MGKVRSRRGRHNFVGRPNGPTKKVEGWDWWRTAAPKPIDKYPSVPCQELADAPDNLFAFSIDEQAQIRSWRSLGRPNVEDAVALSILVQAVNERALEMQARHR